MTTITNPSTIRINVSYNGNGENINASSLTNAVALRETSTLAATIVPLISSNTSNAQVMSGVYEITASSMSDGTYDPVISGQSNTSGQSASATVFSAERITIALNNSGGGDGGNASSGREIILAGRNEFPDPAAEWFSYSDAVVNWTAEGMVVSNSQPTPGYIAATVLGPTISDTDLPGAIFEFDFKGGDPASSQLVGLGKVDFDNVSQQLDLRETLMWNSNGSILAQDGASAPTQVLGRNHRLRIVMNSTATAATLYFLEDANGDGNYTAMTPALETVQTTVQIRDGVQIGFDPAEHGSLTVSRVYIEV